MNTLTRNNSLRHLLSGMALAALIFSAGCKRDTVKVYHVEKDDSEAPSVPAPATPVPNADSAMANSTMVPAPDKSAMPQLKYTLPAGWQEKALTEMRVASFGISENGNDVDVSVIPLSGMAGGDLANVNRWRGQVGVPSLPDDDLQKLAEKVEIAGQPADLYDILGMKPGSSEPERIVGVILHQNDTSWFFKMIGNADLVEKQKPAFVSFLKSIQFGAPSAAAAPAMDMSQLPPSHPPINGMNSGMASANADAGEKPTWTVPAGWQTAPLEQFLIGKYVIAGSAGAQAAVNVSSLAGDGGGLFANVNRWRRQLGLGAIEETDLAKLVSTFETSGTQASVVDFTGTDAMTGKKTRLVGVVLPLGGQTWFYKLMGDDEIVTQQKDAFMKFIQSAKYSDAH